MKNKSFNILLLFSLFGIAYGFFGMLYEGIVVIPQMLDTSLARMAFWRDYYDVINPVIFYIPLLPLATLTLIFLNFTSSGKLLKMHLVPAAIFQIATLAITFYIVKVINLKLCFNNMAQYAGVIHAKVVLANILSVARLILDATALVLVFKACIKNICALGAANQAV